MADEIPETGAVFTFGKSRFADNEPSHFFIKNDPIVAISCGDEHSAVICQNGRVFVFGGNAWGQLGLGHKDEVTRPSCVKWLKPHRALFVACGRAHTVFVTENNAIYTVGCNDEGQLGTGDTEHHEVPQPVEIDCEDDQIKQVSAGSNHTALLTNSGRVFVCGSNSEGQLGLGEDTRSSVKFTELKFMEKIAFVECGYYHTVFITTQGIVFITGDNEGQKLGIPDNTAPNIYVPEVLPLDIPVKDACCGANHTFLLSMDESKIFSFGSNEKGQLGMPKEIENVTKPTEIDMDKMFEGYQLKLVACGAMHTAFVTDNGYLYTCGEAHHNKLCLDEIDDTSSSDSLPNQYIPKRVSAMKGYIVDNVACGGCHTLLTATRELTNNDLSNATDPSGQVTLTELPPLQKIPMNVANQDLPNTMQSVTNSNTDDKQNPGTTNGNPVADESGSMDSLEANVSDSHIVNINDLDPETDSTRDVQDMKDDIEKSEVQEIIENLDSMADNSVKNIENSAKEVMDKAQENVECLEETCKKIDMIPDPGHNCERISLGIPDKMAEIVNSPPPKTPIIQDLLHVPDLPQMLPESIDDGLKSETESKSENETIPCGSDKSSPQMNKSAKTQAVLPIVRSEDALDNDNSNEDGVVVNKLPAKGPFARIFQSIREKENSCMSKGKVIEENVQETVHKGINSTEETIHRLEETVETEVRNQTNSRTCTIL